MTMQFGTSTIMTIGTVLNQAQQHDGQQVEVLVEGHWLTGEVVSLDSHGVVLDVGWEGGPQMAVIRVESISAVRWVTPVSDRKGIEQ